ncbi:MAG: histidine ammonia-lyase [Gammaproteobacteria bacterium]|nr:histidine ammonia-lyase [Gammaproteobacteria bacterium]
MTLELDGHSLTLTDLADYLGHPSDVRLGASARSAMETSAANVTKILTRGEAVYGINTGFGALASKRIADGDLATLQYNLVRSHAAGVGDPLADTVVRLMLILKANGLATGYSGARPALAEATLALANASVMPNIPERGSVGASGDLAPLAHLALALIGEGEATQKGKPLHNAEVMRAAGLEPLVLQPKEGLALLNGTQLSTALAILGLIRGERLLGSAVVAGALSVEALAGSHAPFDEHIHNARGQHGQSIVAAAFRRLLEKSEIWRNHENCDRVQDPYSTRCQPQVLGAVWDTLAHAAAVLEREANGATDNPLVFEDRIISGGNFHAEPIAMVSDFMAIALAEVGSIAERRIDTFMRGINPALPAFLAHTPGLESGFMLAHVTAAALASENKTLAHPASVDTISTSAGQEDHVSMGPWAGHKLQRIADNVARIIAIELVVAAAALDMQRPLKAGAKLEAVHERIRAIVPPASADRRHDRDIAALAECIEAGDIARRLPTDAWQTPLA